MHPAYSVIFFTVSSGAGFGLLFWLGVAPLMGVAPVGAFGWLGFILAFGLSVAGLLSSTQHLGHPERAWRAFTQWRSSWLSREGVLAVLTLGVAGIYGLLALFYEAPSALLGVVTAALSLVTVYATAMIYAQLKTVQRWNTPTTALCYLAFAVAGGALLLVLCRAWTQAEAPSGGVLLAAVLLFAAWALKMKWWKEGDAVKPLSTPESATGLGHLGQVRLLEAPHTGPNYLLREMGYVVARRHAQKLRTVSLALGAAAPALLALVAQVAPGAAVWLSLAAIAHLAGMLAERWLFFAEAEHAVMTYYDRRA